VPFVNIASSLPISWNGLGVREKSYQTFFVASAPGLMTSEQAIAFGALWLLAVMTTSAIGGIVAFVSGDLSSLKRSGSLDEASSTPDKPMARVVQAN
jgi:hypothetical protein